MFFWKLSSSASCKSRSIFDVLRLKIHELENSVCLFFREVYTQLMKTNEISEQNQNHIVRAEKWKTVLRIGWEDNMEGQLMQCAHQQTNQEQTTEQCLEGDLVGRPLKHCGEWTEFDQVLKRNQSDFGQK